MRRCAGLEVHRAWPFHAGSVRRPSAPLPPSLQVDLTEQPGRREGMLADSGGVKALPQLHIDGKLVGAPTPASARGG